MPPFRIAPTLALLCAFCTACTPLRLAPNSFAGEPQGATFLAEPVPKLPIWSEPLRPLPRRAPSLTGEARCGEDAGEQARAQCLRGEGWDVGLVP